MMQGGVREGAGRPIGLAPAMVLREILRAHGKAGRKAVAARLGVSEWVVREAWARAGLRSPGARQAWTETEDAFLRDGAGEMNVARLARELGRSEAAVRWRLGLLGLSVEELRSDLTVEQVAEAIGRSPDWVRSRIARKEVGARSQDGAWRIWPSVLREWVRRDPYIVDWPRLGDSGPYLVALLAGDA